MEEVIVTITILFGSIALIIYIISIIPGWVWCAIFVVIVFIILCGIFSRGSQVSSSSGDYSSSYGGGGSASDRKENKEERGEWAFNEKVIIEGGKISDRGAFGSGILSREVGHAEKRGGPFEYDHIRISKGTFGNEKVAEVRGDKVYDSHGNQVGEVKRGLFGGKTIVGKDGKELGELKD